MLFAGGWLFFIDCVCIGDGAIKFIIISTQFIFSDYYIKEKELSRSVIIIKKTQEQIAATGGDAGNDFFIFVALRILYFILSLNFLGLLSLCVSVFIISNQLILNFCDFIAA